MLECVECGRVSGDGEGWRAEIANDPEDDEPAEVAVYCPACWEREFAGEDGAPSARPDVARRRVAGLQDFSPQLALETNRRIAERRRAGDPRAFPRAGDPRRQIAVTTDS